MRDDQTGSYWQQISGRAISGPLAGAQLQPVHSDELAFALWRTEAPDGTVLRPDARYARDYVPKNWDVRMANVPTVISFPESGLQARDLILGINTFGAARAYRVDRILSEKLVEDHVGAEPIIIVVGPDNTSIRVFRARLPGAGNTPEFYRRVTNASEHVAGSAQSLFMDSASGSNWNFSGCAVSGTLQGTCLEPVNALKDYWFDWRNYHPDTTVFHR